MSGTASSEEQPVRVTCGVFPGPESVTQARVAEDLGYERVWLYDSPALYEDIWIHLARVAEATSTIGLGTAVLVPHTRHVMTTASAIATVERLAPGRLAVGFGTGFTARMVMGQPPLTWAYMETHLRQLRALLAGEVVEIDGAQCQMAHHPELATARPIEVPFVLSAFGPKGTAVARELADGIMGIGPSPDWDWCIQMVNGTVLDDGEDTTSARVREAVGPWFTVTYHAFWEGDPAAVDSLPGGAEWRAGIEAERPEGQRHLAVHEGHVSHLTERDRPLIERDDTMFGVSGNSWIGDGAAIADHVAAAAAAGVTEVLYTPCGPDIERELRTFAAATIG